MVLPQSETCHRSREGLNLTEEGTTTSLTREIAPRKSTQNNFLIFIIKSRGGSQIKGLDVLSPLVNLIIETYNVIML